MRTRPDYSELVAQAERAVSAVKDPALNKIAFQRILDELIGSSPGIPVGKQKR